MELNTTLDPQSVGNNFSPQIFEGCRAKAWELLFALKEQIQPGMKESDGLAAYKNLCKEFGVEKNWHPPKIRFGANSTKGFREPSDESVVLKSNDIFFLDIGPVFYQHEGDVGKSFVIGQNRDYLRACLDCEEIFRLVNTHWKTKNLSGDELYQYASSEASKRGWKLNLNGASGHRIGDFPHAVIHRGSLRDFKHSALPQRWILEIQIRHPELPYGAFYEDVLS